MSTQLIPSDVSLVNINPIDSNAYEEGQTPLSVVGCENDAGIQKSNGLETSEKERETRETVNSVGSKKTTKSLRKESSHQDFQSLENVSPLQVLPQAIKYKLWHLKKTTIIALGTIYKTDEKQMLHNKELPKDYYKVLVDKSLVDAACIPDVGNNGFKTVNDAVGGFFAWPKNQVVLDPKCVSGIVNQNPNRNGNVVAAQAEGNANGNNADLDEIEKVNANCILMANLQQASTSGTQTEKAPVYDSDGSTKVQLFDNCYNNDIFNMFTQEEHMEQGGGTEEQHHATVKKKHAYFESLYNNLAIKVEKVNTVNQADESLAKHKALELEIKLLLRVVVSLDIMSIVQSYYVVDTSNLLTELDRIMEMEPDIKNMTLSEYLEYEAAKERQL
ncbi:hypothetical protein Tco_1405516 [Tanacetum coccineum]